MQRLLPFLATVSLALPMAARATEREIVVPSITPERVAGETHVAGSLAAILTGSTTHWDPRARIAEFRRDGRVLKLKLGSNTARLNGRTVRLGAAPFLRQGEVMVPLKRVASAFAVPVRFEAATDSVVVGHLQDQRFTLPLATRKTGFVLHTPAPNTEWNRNLRIQGQANLPPSGRLIVQLQNQDGRVVAHGEVTAEHCRKGAFGEFLVLLGRSSGDGAAYPARLVAYQEDGSGARVGLSRVVPIRFSEQ